MNKSFLLLFFKKEDASCHLSSFSPLGLERSFGDRSLRGGGGRERPKRAGGCFYSGALHSVNAFSINIYPREIPNKSDIFLVGIF